MKYCDICGQPHTNLDTHHLLSGVNRKEADNSGLTIEICRICHSSIHNSAVSETLCKMLGQALFENSYTHQEYMKKFGKNFLPNKDERDAW